MSKPLAASQKGYRMIPKRIHQTARSKLLSPAEQRLGQRNRRVLVNWKFDIWDDHDNLALMKRCFPNHVARYERIVRGVIRADIARCMYLYVFGGLYMDTDYKIIRPIDDDVLSHICILPVSRADEYWDPNFRVCNSVIASEEGYPFWKDFIDVVFSIPDLETLSEDRVETSTGPEALTRFYLKRRLDYPGIYTVPRKYFHPRVSCRGLYYDRSFSSYGVHLCWASWRSSGLLRRFETRLVRYITSL
jgi:mannosyltransferase OCH1-like enzyme